MKLLIPALALTSSVAVAADLKFNVEGRFDYHHSTLKHDRFTATENYKQTRREFSSGPLRINAVATFSENLLFRMRYRLSTAQGITNTTGTETESRNLDLTFKNVDFFYIDHKNEFFTARLGKHSHGDSLGREFYTSGSDYPTTFLSGAYGTLNTAVYSSVSTDANLYHVGATLMFNQIPNATLSVAAFNPKAATYSDTAGNGNDAENTELGLGIYYNANYYNKLLQPTLGYTMFSIAPETDGTNTVDATHKLLSAGVRSEVAGFVIDADWKQYKKEHTGVAGATSTASETTSIWANVAYKMGNLTPFVNYINDKYDLNANNASDYKRNAISAGLWFKPIQDMNFRYHVTYTNDVKEWDAPTAGDRKLTANQIAAGIKFDI